MKVKIGIMQGRLTPPIGGKIQAFPVHRWKEEFPTAHACGFEAIEWIFEDHDDENPIWTEEGLEEILEISQKHQIEIPSLCADYFMKHPFFRTSSREKIDAIHTLQRLMLQCATLGIRRILLPVLEEAEIETESEQREFVTSLKECLPMADEFKIELAVESNLEAERYRSLMETLNHPFVKIYYDIGNRTAMGYSLEDEIRKLGQWISGAHVKDRKRSGPTVPLGTGDVNFRSCFQALHDVGFRGPYILQAARQGDPVEDARRYLEFVRRILPREKSYREFPECV